MKLYWWWWCCRWKNPSRSLFSVNKFSRNITHPVCEHGIKHTFILRTPNKHTKKTQWRFFSLMEIDQQQPNSNIYMHNLQASSFFSVHYYYCHHFSTAFNIIHATNIMIQVSFIACNGLTVFKKNFVSKVSTLPHINVMLTIITVKQNVQCHIFV